LAVVTPVRLLADCASELLLTIPHLTGNDALGSSIRLGAKSVANFELLPEPPVSRARDNQWPQFPRVRKTDYGHQEVADKFGKDPRTYSITTTKFEKDDEGNLAALHTAAVQWTKDAQGRWKMEKVPGSEKRWPCQACFLALGFLSPEKEAFASLSLEQDGRGNIKADDNKGKSPYATSVPNVYACGDARRGQSLIVWGIQEGRACAAVIDTQLQGNTRLPWAGGIPARRFDKFVTNSPREKVASAA
jgi:glutamate synthase (NADPH/NADH)